jgi:phosphotransacetylase
MPKLEKIQKELFLQREKDENMLKAAIEFGRNRLGIPVLIGVEKKNKRSIKEDWLR